MNPRTELADALRAKAPPTVTVGPEDTVQAPGLPALIVRPASPYRGPSQIPYCTEAWRLEVLCLAPAAGAGWADALDDLLELVRATVKDVPNSRWLGASQAGRIETIGGKPHRTASTEVEMHR